MKRIGKVAVAVCMALIIAVQTAFPAFAHSNEIEDIFSYFTAEDGFYDGLGFGENDWAAYCRLRLYGTDGAEDYLRRVQSSAEELMKSEGFVKPTELQRAAIVLSAADMCSEQLINAAVYNNEKLDRQGINAYIWALIAANCCEISQPENALNTKSSLAEYLISKQLSDGGFALKGTAADTDITAAVIYALAPLREDDSVAGSLEKAEQCLVSLQLDSGGFTSMGIENCESVAQAIIAMSALGYDESDSRVSSAVSALMGYRNIDGGFSHIGGESSGIATTQSLQALTALELGKRGESFFCVSENSAAATETIDIPVDSNDNIVPHEHNETSAGDTIRVILAAVVLVGGAALIVVWLIRGRKKLLLFVAGAVMMILAAVLWLSDIRTPEEYYSESGASGSITVTVSAECLQALAHPEKAAQQAALPESGYIIRPIEVSLAEGATAFDALLAAAKEQHLTIEHSSSAMGVYVAGIGGLYEFDYGSECGWLYYVHGERPSCSASSYTVSHGDTVDFVYTTHLSY